MRPRLSLEGRLAGAAFGAALLSAGLLGLLLSLGLPPVVSGTLAAAAGLAGAVGGIGWAWKPVGDSLRGIADGVRGFQENDFGFRLGPESEDEIGALVGLFNRMGDVLRTERREIYERELLLDAVLQGAPMAILLLNARDRAVYANAAARRLFAGSGRLVGLELHEIAVPSPALREALLSGADATVAARADGREEETWRVAVRAFHLHTQRHRLVVVETLTADVRKQELDAWRKVIRVVSHEVNNSLAPVSSLVHSARLAAASPRHMRRLEEILATIEERVHHLSRFLEGYAALARIPKPAPEPVAWGPFLESVRRAVPFRLARSPEPPVAVFDPAQIQQVLLNLLKNAAEAGGPPEEIAVSVEPGPSGGSLLRILDRGPGMDADAMRRAALPFSASTRGARGLGLPLCAEILAAHGGTLTLSAREGGGTTATCFLPERDALRARAQAPEPVSASEPGRRAERRVREPV